MNPITDDNFEQFTEEEIKTAEKSKQKKKELEASAEKTEGGFMSKLAFTGSKVMNWWGARSSGQACKCSPEDEELGCCM